MGVTPPALSSVDCAASTGSSWANGVMLHSILELNPLKHTFQKQALWEKAPEILKSAALSYFWKYLLSSAASAHLRVFKQIFIFLWISKNNDSARLSEVSVPVHIHIHFPLE